MASPDELTTAVDCFVADVRAIVVGSGDLASFSVSLSTLLAVVIGRATAMAASAVTGLAKPFDLRLGRIETQLTANSRFLHEIHTRLDMYASRLDRLEQACGDDSERA